MQLLQVAYERQYTFLLCFSCLFFYFSDIYIYEIYMCVCVRACVFLHLQVLHFVVSPQSSTELLHSPPHPHPYWVYLFIWLFYFPSFSFCSFIHIYMSLSLPVLHLLVTSFYQNSLPQSSTSNYTSTPSFTHLHQPYWLAPRY